MKLFVVQSCENCPNGVYRIQGNECKPFCKVVGELPSPGQYNKGGWLFPESIPLSCPLKDAQQMVLFA